MAYVKMCKRAKMMQLTSGENFTVNFCQLYCRRGGEIGETDDDTQSGSATDIIGTSEVRFINIVNTPEM